MALISKYFPHISKTFMTNKDMAGVFDSIKKQGYGVFIRYASTKRLHTTGGKPESAAMRTNIAHHNFFKELHREGASASTVCYTVAGSRSPNAHPRHAASGGTLARDCRFLVAGEAGLLFKTVIPKVLSTSRRRNECLEKCAECGQRHAGAGIPIHKFDFRRGLEPPETLTGWETCRMRHPPRDAPP